MTIGTTGNAEIAEITDTFTLGDTVSFIITGWAVRLLGRQF